ncbi:HAMP domain-containing histidine kinase, partial [Frankia sp. AiPs1]|uniref:HAMP domain-containing sensor histidine kinase n=1 Tax=Frankia sp. AiPs1 TaxID=573493 RepID=UPI00204456DD
GFARRVGPRGRSRLRFSSPLGRLTLRARLALLVGMAVAAAVAMVAGVSLGATSIVLNQAIDDQLIEQAEASADTIQTNSLGLGLGLQAFSFGLEGQFLDANGNPLQNAVSSWNSVRIPVDAAEAEVARRERTQNLRTITVAGQSYRLVTVPLQRPASGGALQLARPTTDVDRTLRDLGLVLLVVGVVGVVGSALAGRIVARAALKPVDAAAAAAEEVARTQDLSALIPVTGADEITRLAESLNSMLRALEASRARQRQLVDDASHELRTPLTSLRTNIELLLRAEANPHRALPAADREALLRDVDAQMRELSGLVSELVELARDELPTEDVERLDLAEIVAAAAERVRRRATGKGIRIEVDAAGSSVDGRANMLERAVTNLLDNAVKFSPPASVVRVRTRAGEVTVADDGPGIDPQERAQVFDRFYRATSARGLPGSGLGLAIVADAVQTHGGTVTAEGSPSGGALLRMRLPLATPDPSDPGDGLILAGGLAGTDPDLAWRPPPAADPASSPWRRTPAQPPPSSSGPSSSGPSSSGPSSVAPPRPGAASTTGSPALTPADGVSRPGPAAENPGP